MPDQPAPEHTEAVAHHLPHIGFCGCEDGHREQHCIAYQEGYAQALLTSTDPTVLDAMQDALVRAGRLTEETDTDWCSEVNTWWRCPASTYDSPYTCGDQCNLAGPHVAHECVDGHTTPFEADEKQPQRTRRYVTAWEPQP